MATFTQECTSGLATNKSQRTNERESSKMFCTLLKINNEVMKQSRLNYMNCVIAFQAITLFCGIIKRCTDAMIIYTGGCYT